MGHSRMILVALCLLLSGAAAGAGTPPGPMDAERDANGWSGAPSISADGRYVAFMSYAATNLVPSDRNGWADIFVHDRRTGITRQVSVSPGGRNGNGESFSPSISADGRYVAFVSLASNLVSGDRNRCPDYHIGGYRTCSDVFVHDRLTGVTVLASVTSSGRQANLESNGGPSISPDGRYVAFEWGFGGGVFVRDLWRKTTTRVAGPTSFSFDVSAGARYLAFQTDDSPSPDDTDPNPDVYLLDRASGALTLVSVSSSGAKGNDSSLQPSISADGRYVAFMSYATNLVPGDTNVCGLGFETVTCPDVFVYDRLTRTTRRVSVSSEGRQADAASFAPAISANGRLVAFISEASNLVEGDSGRCPPVWGTLMEPEIRPCRDVFVHDLVTGRTTRVSLSSSEQEGNGASGLSRPSLSADGRFVAFDSRASNLVERDTNWCDLGDSCSDVFVRDRARGTTTRVSVPTR